MPERLLFELGGLTVSSTLAMACCCTASGTLWVIGVWCDNLAQDPEGPEQTEFPVVRRSWLEENLCFDESTVLKIGGKCYNFSVNGPQVIIDGEPDGEPYFDGESGEDWCNCWLCDDEVELIDPVPGNPSDGSPNCCPNDMGCTTFGAKTIDARVRVKGSVTVRTRCGSGPFTYVTNTYSWDVEIDDDGSSCSRSGGATEVLATEAWNDCFGGYSGTPRVSFTAAWNGSTGLTSATASIFNLPNMPGQLVGGQALNFSLRLRGGDPELTPLGAGWNNYTVEEYAYNEAVLGECENQFAASGRMYLELNTDVNQVTISMQISGALDNLGPCP